MIVCQVTATTKSFCHFLQPSISSVMDGLSGDLQTKYQKVASEYSKVLTSVLLTHSCLLCLMFYDIILTSKEGIWF